MSWASISTALKARLDGLAGAPCGKVWPFQRTPQGTRMTSNDSAFKNLFCPGGGRVNTWFITRTDRNGENIIGSTSRGVFHQALLMGFFEVSDVDLTDQTFELTVEAVCQNLEDGDETLAGACKSYSNAKANIGYGQLMNANCHFARITFEVEEVR